MFTGLIQAIGSVVRTQRTDSGLELWVDLGPLAARCGVGDSIALSGCCCTVVAVAERVARFHLSAETLRRTWLGSVGQGTQLNLEAALRAGDPLGGHIVQGHVDGLAVVVRPVGREGGEWGVELPAGLERYAVAKGSIALDGVSLTVASLDAKQLVVAIIPHTASVTTIGTRAAGDRLNVEVDILAKYVEKLLPPR